MTHPHPTLILTMGDPAGIGPEVLCKALANEHIHGLSPLVFGELPLLEDTARQLGLPVRFHQESEAVSERDYPGLVLVPVRSFNLAFAGTFESGKVSARCGEASFRYFEAAVKACLDGSAQGIVTAPICKEALNLAGHSFVGHTDILEQMTGVPSVVMALVHPRLMVSHVTDHLPLRLALDAITRERIQEVVRLTWKSLQAMHRHPKGQNPRIALAGVNPHAGENGLFGREELDVLVPAMKTLEKEGIPTLGPFPGDTVFLQGLRGRFDAVIAMYHDQGFGPMKTVDMAQGVNCTLGLPFVRTSPDHGTAFDIVGKGLAESDSMRAAISLARRLLLNQTGEIK